MASNGLKSVAGGFLPTLVRADVERTLTHFPTVPNFYFHTQFTLLSVTTGLANSQLMHAL